MAINGHEFVNGLDLVTQVYPTLKGLSKPDMVQFFREALDEADARFALQQRVDDAIKLQPGLEELSDIVLAQVFSTALPMAMAELVSSVLDGDDTDG